MSSIQETPLPRFSTTVADPAALGLAGFALTTFVLSLANAGFIAGAGSAVLGLALFYGGIAQLLAGMWEFVKGNTFGAAAFSSYGAFWLAFWWLLTNPEAAKAAGPGGVGAFLLGWTIFTAYMTIGAVKTTRITFLVFAALTLTFLFLAIGEFSSTAAITHVGGYLGLLTALLAWYGSAASVTNSTWKRSVLPVGAPR
jgi:succinate-acetate transporter protein